MNFVRYGFSAAMALLLAIPAAAAPIGNFSISSLGGGVTVTSSSIDWLPPTGGGYGDFSTGSDTSISYNNGVGTVTLTNTTNSVGRILDLTVGPGPVNNFIQWYISGAPITTVPELMVVPGTALQANPRFRLDGFNPDPSAQIGCAGVTSPGESCRPVIGGTFVSPFVLTMGTNQVSVTLDVLLTGFDATPDAGQPWTGGFTTQVPNTTAEAIEQSFNTGGSISRTYSSSFNASATIPEPATAALLGAGLLFAGLIGRRRIRR